MTESKVFEIQDFTIATDWENFIAECEKTLRYWNLSVDGKQKQTNKQIMRIESQEIIFDDYHGSFILSFYQWKHAENVKGIHHKHALRHWEENLQEQVEADYLKAHISLLSKSNLYKFIHWFNCKEFLLLQPKSSSFSEVTLNQAQAHLLLSSLAISLSNINR